MIVSKAKEFRGLMVQNHECVTNVGISALKEETISSSLAKLNLENIQHFEEKAVESSGLTRALMLNWKKQENMAHTDEFRDLLSEHRKEVSNILARKDFGIRRLKVLVFDRIQQTNIDFDKRKEKITMITERVKNLVDNMEQTAKDQVDAIMEMVKSTQKQMFDSAMKELSIRSDEHFNNLRSINYEKLRTSIFTRYKECQRLKVKSYDELSPVRLEIAEELQKLQVNLWEMRNKIVNNLGKLKYNYQLIQMQIEECRQSHSKMLRKKFKLFDEYVELKRKEKNMTRTEALEKTRKNLLSKKEQASQRGKRIEFLHDVNVRKHTAIFHQQREEVRTRLKRIFEIDQIIHRNILNTKWEEPDLSFLSWEVPQISAEEERLRCLINSFLDDTIVPLDTVMFGPHAFEIPDRRPQERLIISKPLDMERLLHFLFDSLDFVVSEREREFARRKYPETMDFIISNTFLPALGVQTIDHLNMLAAHMLDKATEIGSSGDVVLERKNSIEGFEDWKKFYNYKMNFSGGHPVTSLPDKGEKYFWEICKCTFTEAKENLWDELCLLLPKYLQILDERNKLQRQVISKKKAIIELANAIGVQLVGVEQFHRDVDRFENERDDRRTDSAAEERDSLWNLKNYLGEGSNYMKRASMFPADIAPFKFTN